MKLWEKGIKINKLIESFTIGRDNELDLYLAPWDILGSIAHATMLQSINLINEKELKLFKKELSNLYKIAIKGELTIEEGIEDIHSQIEHILTRKLGDVGKKIHSGRSRNDQVLVDLKLFIRHELKEIVDLTNKFFNTLIRQSQQHKDILMPGYTHLQIAMPSSFGLWFGAFAESLTDDMQLLLAAHKINNQNPLGSAAGYGNSFPLNRQMTTEMLGFDQLNFNVVYAQMGRGKVEKTVAFALSSVATTISKLANDMCLFMSQNFGFVSLPDDLTTGSSIMPHKKNPDVCELLRAKCNKIQTLSNEISFVVTNLPTGYFRDMQVLKESFFPVFNNLKECLIIANFIIDKLVINKNILKDSKYKYLFTVEEVNKEVMRGIPFREAYKKVSKSVDDGTYNPEIKIAHTHEGSIGNLCNGQIMEKMNKIIEKFEFEKIEKILKQLVDN